MRRFLGSIGRNAKELVEDYYLHQWVFVISLFGGGILVFSLLFMGYLPFPLETSLIDFIFCLAIIMVTIAFLITFFFHLLLIFLTVFELLD